MKRILLLLSVSILFLLSIYVSPSFATNVQFSGPCEDATSYCNANGLSYDSTGCKNSCIDGNTCWNGFKGTCTLSISSKGWMCDYAYQDPTPPNCGTCGVQTCSGLAGWWCKPDDTKCSGGKVCDATNKCSCPSGTSWDGTKCSITSPPVTCTNPSSYSNSNNCQSAGCAWCAPPAYSGYCAASSSDCTSPCKYTGNPTKDDAACPDTCETGGCNLRINVCTVGGTCGYSGTSKFCGIGNSCDKGVECYQSTGACGGGGSSAGGF